MRARLDRPFDRDDYCLAQEAPEYVHFKFIIDFDCEFIRYSRNTGLLTSLLIYSV
jgi:hypothetical protein